MRTIGSITLYKSKQFLFDFDLQNKAAIDRVVKKNPMFYRCVKRGKDEGDKHYNCKKTIFETLYELNKFNSEFFICNELQQKYNPFRFEIHITDSNKPTYYRPDICCLFFHNKRDPVIVDIEIDGWEHFTKSGRIRGQIRDELMFERYGVNTVRVDYDDWDLNDVIKKVMDYNRIDCKMYQS